MMPVFNKFTLYNIQYTQRNWLYSQYHITQVYIIYQLNDKIIEAVGNYLEIKKIINKSGFYFTKIHVNQKRDVFSNRLC